MNIRFRSPRSHDLGPLFRLLVAAAAIAAAALAAAAGHRDAGGTAYAPAPSARGTRGPAAVAISPSAAVIGPTVVRPDSFDISPPLRDVVVLPRPTFASVEVERQGVATNQRAALDPVAQRTTPSTSMPAPLSTFEGVGNADNFALNGGFRGWPPDVEGDVGPNDYVEYTNLVWSVYDKATGAPRANFPKSNGAIWAGMSDTTCANEWQGDPVVIYDHAADRWLLSEMAFTRQPPPNAPLPPYKICIAVSTTGDPAGSYARYSYTFQKWADYPKFGVWPDGYYMSANLFTTIQCCPVFSSSGVAAFDRAKMIAGDPSASMVFFDTNNQRLDSMLPSDWEGDIPPPAGAPDIFLASDDDAVDNSPTDRLQVWKFDADFSGPTPTATFTHTADLPTATFDQNVCNFPNPFAQACIPQPGTGNRLDAMDDRLMHRLQYRRLPSGQQSLVTNQTVDENGLGHAGIRWYELRLDGSFNPSIFQQGTYAPDAHHRSMGSAAMDATGNIAIGYSLSSDTVSPSIRYSGRLASDTAGQLGQGETELQAGGGSQTNSNRWGDYTALQIDPVDECTFWYVNEYYSSTNANNDWQTRFGSFRFPGCSQTPALVVVTKTADQASVIAGSQIGFGVTLDNFTGVAATGLGFTDNLPGGAGVNWSIDGLNSDAGWLVNGAPPNQSLAYSPTTLAGNSSTHVHVVSSTPADSCGTFSNNASFTSSNGGSGQNSASLKVLRPATVTFSQNFDGVTAPALPAGWTATNAAGPAPLWVTSDTGTPAPAADSAPNAAYVDDPSTVSDKQLVSPSYTVVSSTAQLSFRQNRDFESGFDGGALEISIAGGSFTDIVAAGGSFVTGGYNTASLGGNSALAGRPAWTGSSGGFVTTTVNLPPSAAGQSIRLRWRLASDSSVGRPGWRVDSVSITDSPPCQPTAVKVAWVSARFAASGVLVRWRTTSAARFLGFDVFRQARTSRTRLNTKLIVARRSAHTYSYVDTQNHGHRRDTYWIRAVGFDGSRTWYGPAGGGR